MHPVIEGGGVAADVGLGYTDHPGVSDLPRLVDEVVLDVLGVCLRRGRQPDPMAVRKLVERSGTLALLRS